MPESNHESKPTAVKQEGLLTQFVLKRFGRRVNETRRCRGLSQEELCARAGLNRTYLSDIERGHGNATLTILTKISTALQTSLSDLLQEVENCKKIPAKILLSDIPQAQARLRRLLEGHHLICTKQQKDAMILVQEDTFDLIISGLHYADGQVFDLLRLTRAYDSNRNTPFICFRESGSEHVTPLIRQALSISCTALGASSYLEIDKHNTLPENDLKLRNEIELWLPPVKRLWT